MLAEQAGDKSWIVRAAALGLPSAATLLPSMRLWMRRISCEYDADFQTPEAAEARQEAQGSVSVGLGTSPRLMSIGMDGGLEPPDKLNSAAGKAEKAPRQEKL